MKLLFFTIPLLALVYVMFRIYNLLPAFKTLGVVLSLGLLAGMVLMIVFGMEKLPMKLAQIIYQTTTSWLFILLYLFMIFLLMDALRLLHIIPKELLFDSWKGTLIITAIIVAIFVYGNIHYHDKKRVEVNIKSDKVTQPTKIVMISDLHLGYHNQRKTLAKWVDMINKENPDIVLIAGDIIDFTTNPLFEQRSYEEFHRVKAPIYACLGNHEYIARTNKTTEFFDKAHINLLIDTCAEFQNLLIVGRNDRTAKNRKKLDKLINANDTSRFIILLDHQPYDLQQAQNAKVDFQFSGHTHRGQVFPINLITDAIYEKSHGEYHKGSTTYYISSGLGIWGGKFRIGSQSEYAVLTINNRVALPK